MSLTKPHSRERLSQEHLDLQHAQIQLARSITRISPVAIVQHLLRFLPEQGLNDIYNLWRMCSVTLVNTENLSQDMDRADPDSLHIIGVREGMSQKPVTPEAVPKFEIR